MKNWQRSLLIVTGLLFVGTAVAYAQLPEPKVHEFPYLGNRGAVWIVAQLHILFAAFILGAPIFVVVSEILGWKNQDGRYERLAKEVTKRSEEHTSELQSRVDLVCRLLLEKK